MAEETLTVHVAIGSEVDIQSPEPAPLQDDSVLLEQREGEGEGEGEGEMGTGGGGGVSGGREEGEGGGGDVGSPNRLQRFYFESDALVLKNNIE